MRDTLLPMFPIYVGCAALGGLAVLVRTIVFFQVNINTKAFLYQIKKLLAANNAERAIKLCSAAPKSPMATITRAMLERKIDGAGSDGLRDTFTSNYQQTVVRFARGAMLSNVALGLSAVMLALPSQDTGIPLGSSLIAPVCIASVASLLVLSFRKLRKDIGEAGDELVAAMTD